MKIVFYSPNFYPLVGGLENVVMDLAVELSRRNHDVRVLTLTLSSGTDSFPFELVRGFTFVEAVRHINWGDVFVQFNISLKGILPWLFTSRPLVATHHNLYPNKSITGWLKKVVARRLANVNTGCSQFIADHYHQGIVLPNPYNEQVFEQTKSEKQEGSIVFLGRLVSDKGCSIVLDALSQLNRNTALKPYLTIVGDGPEKDLLIQKTDDLGLQGQVRFAGTVVGRPLASLLQEQQIMVVPSAYQEPFGIVALEGIASSCFVIGSDTGGLPEAIGPCGVTFRMGNVSELTSLLEKALTDHDWRVGHLTGTDNHLWPHRRSAVADRFLDIVNVLV